jgi:hypothetical protein
MRLSKPTPCSIRYAMLCLPIIIASTTAYAAPSSSSGTGWEASAVLDLGHSSRKLELGARDRGIEMGHSDVVLRGPLGPLFTAEVAAAAHTGEGKTEKHTESFWIQTRTLPAGLQSRLGRFRSQIGYLNEQHPHADDFSERPLIYRAFLGRHWIDDGVRLNWTAPTPFYLRFGVEAMSGRQLVRETMSHPSVGARTLTMKTGSDISANSSWQFGLSYLNNRRQAMVETHHHDDEEGHGEHGGHSAHDHAHGALFSGRNTWMSDLVYKWAPDGNPRNQQVRLAMEHARVGGIHPQSGARRHAGSALSAVWRFHPSWEVGAKTDRLRVNRPEFHDDGEGPVLEFANARLREHALMIAYKPGHMQTYRLQISRQKAGGLAAADVFAHPVSMVVQLQTVIAFGAHGAHSY